MRVKLPVRKLNRPTAIGPPWRLAMASSSAVRWTTKVVVRLRVSRIRVKRRGDFIWSYLLKVTFHFCETGLDFVSRHKIGGKSGKKGVF